MIPLAFVCSEGLHHPSSERGLTPRRSRYVQLFRKHAKSRSSLRSRLRSSDSGGLRFAHPKKA